MTIDSLSFLELYSRYDRLFALTASGTKRKQRSPALDQGLEAGSI
jgi:hypothetical protein